MTDKDRARDGAAAKIKRPKSRKRGPFSIEGAIWLGLFVVAGGAAFLPWYAVTGNHGLGIRNDGHLRLSGHRDDRDRSLYSALRPFGRNRDPLSGRSGPDTLETGAIPEISRQMQDARNRSGPKQQPFPGRPFHLVHVANGQALISDGKGIYLVGIGSQLPDGSRLKRFDRRGDDWVIVTSEGSVIGE